MKIILGIALSLQLFGILQAEDKLQVTLPALKGGVAPQNFEEMWAGFDPRKEPLDVEVLQEWEEEGIVLRIVRFRIGIFKGVPAKLAAIYGFPKADVANGDQVPGLVQIHGGGQYADYKACLLNGKRGYATVSLAWAGRISAPNYRVNPDGVKLFWDNKTDDPDYKLTTDWGVLDGYHAPGRNVGNQFPSARAAAWTLDDVESPRNSGWFLCALAARRALTFLEQQPEVDPDKLGVYGHSMGGKLTVMTAVDERVKAAAPSCGGISDRDNDSPLFRATIGDDVSLKQISCPIFVLSPANDFHGRLGDLPAAVNEIQSNDWRVTCAPHHNHQDTDEYEVATLLWFDQHLKNAFKVPKTPWTELNLKTSNGVPTITVKPDDSLPILSVEVFYSQQGKMKETRFDSENTKHRFWHHAKPTKQDGRWTAELPVYDTDNPLWVYANVSYPLDKPVIGAGYYYGQYAAESFNLSSLLQKTSSKELQSAGVQPTLQPTLTIEEFSDGWEHEWYTYKPENWARSTHKLYSNVYKAPDGANLALEIQSESANELVILIDDHAAVVSLAGGTEWQTIILSPSDFKNLVDESLPDWSTVKKLTLSPAERLRAPRGSDLKSKIVGKNWIGNSPQFRNLHWTLSEH